MLRCIDVASDPQITPQSTDTEERRAVSLRRRSRSVKYVEVEPAISGMECGKYSSLSWESVSGHTVGHLAAGIQSALPELSISVTGLGALRLQVPHDPTCKAASKRSLHQGAPGPSARTLQKGIGCSPLQ